MTDSTSNPNESRKLKRLDIFLVLSSEDDIENEISSSPPYDTDEDEDVVNVTALSELPIWTVYKDKDEFYVSEGLTLVKKALAKRFSLIDVSEPVAMSVAVDFRSRSGNEL